jgi:hypothetical protein
VLCLSSAPLMTLTHQTLKAFTLNEPGSFPSWNGLCDMEQLSIGPWSYVDEGLSRSIVVDDFIWMMVSVIHRITML